MIGRKLSNYHINERIGEGGMGTVYKATDVNLKRTVAVKMLHPFLVSNGDSLKRFQNEAHLSARISHPNVATLLDFKASDQSHFIVMEYVNGRALDDILKIQNRLPEKEAVRIIIQVLEGLGAAHELGILHRDLKPGNIMITQRGFVKLMDFGIARLENTERMTRQNSVIGTLEYLSPELVKGGNPSKAADLYAVGVMLHEMLSGQSLYAGDSEASLMYQIAHKAPQLQLQGVNRQLAQVVKKLTQKQTHKRYTSTTAVIEALEKIYSAGRINTALLDQKPLLAPQEEQKTIALPFKLEWPAFKLPSAINMPFDIDFRILAGALVTCLLILIVGRMAGGDEAQGAQDGSLSEQEDLLSATAAEGEISSESLAQGGLPIAPNSDNRIQFIERFEDKEASTTEPKKERKTNRKEPKKASPPQTTKDRANKAPAQAEAKTTTYPKAEEPAENKAAESIEAPIQPGSSFAKEEAEPTKIERMVETPASPTKQVTVRIPDMFVSASFASTVSTTQNSQGEIIYLKTSQAIYQGEHLIIPRGAPLQAEIKKLRPAQGKKKAFMAIELKAVQAINGEWLTVSYPEYSNISKTLVAFQKGSQLSKIKIKSTNITLNY